MTSQWIIAGIAGWNALVTTFGVVGVTWYASGFRLKARCHMDPSNVVRIRLANWGRLDGEIDFVLVVVRCRLLHRLRYREPYRVVCVVKAPESSRVESGTLQTWWTQIDLTNAKKLPSEDRRQRWVVVRVPRREELRVCVQGATGSVRYRRIRHLRNNLYHKPANLR